MKYQLEASCRISFLYQPSSSLICDVVYGCIRLPWWCLNVSFTGNYVLNYLATRPKLAAFVTQALIQLYARITKLGWFDCQKDDYVFRNVIADVTRFLQVCGRGHRRFMVT